MTSAVVIATHQRDPRWMPHAPTFPWITHAFAPHAETTGMPTQCGLCWGWYDDPRHFNKVT